MATCHVLEVLSRVVSIYTCLTLLYDDPLCIIEVLGGVIATVSLPPLVQVLEGVIATIDPRRSLLKGIHLDIFPLFHLLSP